VRISAVIIAGDEEANIGDAVRSVGWAEEVLVIDSESGDRTREVAAGLGARVVVRAWPGFAAQKQFGVDEAEHDWIFSLDADERVSPRLHDEIIAIKDGGPAADGYRVPRLSTYMGRAIRHGGWYPDWQLRLFDRRRGRWKDVVVHESVEMAAGSRIEKLKGEILHFPFAGPLDHQAAIESRYAPLAARQMFERRVRTSAVRAAFVGPAAFLSTYLLRLGLLDGAAGFHIARLAAYHARLKYKLLRDMQRQ
jgi:glycosyltransferase involved in cell wall biosynthesis